MPDPLWRRWLAAVFPRRAEDRSDAGLPPIEVLLDREECQHVVTEALVRSKTLEEATGAVLEPCCRATGALAGAVWLVDDGTQTLQCARFFARDPERASPGIVLAASGSTLEKGKGLAGRAWAEGHAAWAGDRRESEDSTLCRSALSEGLHGGCAFPIRRGGRIDGVIELFTEDPVDPDDHLRKMMESIGGQIGLFLERVAIGAKQRFLASIVSASDDAIVGLTPEGAVSSWNRGAERLYGYSAAEMVGQPMALTEPPELEGETARYLERVRGGEHLEQLETRRVRRDRRPIDVSITMSPLSGPDGGLVAVATIGRDITQLKRAQEALVKKAADLERSNAELDDFAYVASHDLKEPLRGIHNYAQFLVEDHGKSLNEDARSMLETLPRLAQRMDVLLDVLLQFSRIGRQEMVPAPTDLNEVLQEALDDVLPDLRGPKLEVRIPAPLPTVRCDRASVVHVFRNLLTNAAQYNDKPEKWVEIGFEEVSDPAPAPATYPVFHVRDNGIGIPRKHAGLVFRIFKRLHGRDAFGGGSGAGLTIVKKIVERHGGTIWLESEVGVGTTFRFTLAESRSKPAPTPVRAASWPADPVPQGPSPDRR